jgi:Methyltransferase FkbM domain
MNLKEFENNIQSQFGEDGVIAEIFKKIGIENKICIEFGAWDGIHLSNTWNLWKNLGWESLLIEGDPVKYKELTENIKKFPNVKALNVYVSFEGENSLDNILKNFNFPKNIDLLSIDIDGDDYYILESLNNFSPRLIIIEYNPTIPQDIELIQSKGEYFGASALSILKLSHQKKYKLVHMTETNMFLLNEDDFTKLEIEEQLLEDLFISKNLAYIVSAYDGKTFLIGTPPYSQFGSVKTKNKYPSFINSNDIDIDKVVIQKLIHQKTSKKWFHRRG